MEILLKTIYVLCMLFHTYTDYKEMLLYDWVNCTIAITGVIYSYLYADIIFSFYGFIIALMIMLIIYFVSRGGLGEGDVKLAPCMGIWLGFENTLIALLISFVLGALIGGCFILVRKQKFNTAIPFGPFLCLGALVSFFYNQELINIYTKVFIA